MTGISSEELHLEADSAAHSGRFVDALRRAGEIIRWVPSDYRARIKVAFSLLALEHKPEAIQVFVATVGNLERQGFLLTAMGVLHDAMRLIPSSADLRQTLRELHQRIHNLPHLGRASVPPPSTPVELVEDDPGSLLRVEDQEHLIHRVYELAVASYPHNDEVAPVGHVPFFSDLGSTSFEKIFKKAKHLKVDGGVRLFSEGDEADSLYVILHGGVLIKREQDVLAELRAGMLLGELALCTQRPRMASAITSEPTELFEIEKSALNELAESEPGITTDVVRFARKRLIMNTLASSPVFTGFSETAKQALFKIFETRSFPPRTKIVREGQPGQGLYIILDGEVEVSKRDDEGDDVTLAYLREGDPFGEISLIEEGATSASVTTLGQTTVLFLKAKDFAKTCQRFPELAEYLTQISVERLEANEVVSASEGIEISVEDLIWA